MMTRSKKSATTSASDERSATKTTLPSPPHRAVDMAEAAAAAAEAEAAALEAEAAEEEVAVWRAAMAVVAVAHRGTHARAVARVEVG